MISDEEIPTEEESDRAETGADSDDTQGAETGAETGPRQELRQELKTEQMKEATLS